MVATSGPRHLTGTPRNDMGFLQNIFDKTKDLFGNLTTPQREPFRISYSSQGGSEILPSKDLLADFKKKTQEFNARVPKLETIIKPVTVPKTKFIANPYLELLSSPLAIKQEELRNTGKASYTAQTELEKQLFGPDTIYASQGGLQSALNYVSMIPVVGLGAKGLTTGAKVARTAQTGVDILKEVRTITKPVAPKIKLIDTLGNAAIDAKAWMQTKFTSSFTPLRTIEKDVLKTAGITEKPAVDMARKFEQIAGANAKAELDVNNFIKTVVNPVAKNYDDFNDYLFLRRTEARLTADPVNKQVGAWTLGRATDGLSALRSKVGEAVWNDFNTVAGRYTQNMDYSLKLQVQSGRMTQAEYDLIKGSTDFYAPFKVLRNLDELEEGVATYTKGKRIPGVQPLTRKIVGIADDGAFAIDDILKNSATQIQKSRLLAERNMKMLELGDLAKLDEMGEHLPFLRNADNVSKRIEIYKELANLRDALKPASREWAKGNKLSRKSTALVDKMTREVDTLVGQFERDASSFFSPSEMELAKARTLPQKVRAKVAEETKAKTLASTVKRIEGRRLDIERQQDIVQPSIHDYLRTVASRIDELKTQRGALWLEAKTLADKPTPRGYTRVSYLRDGIKESIAVPDDVAKALEGGGPATTGIIMKTLALAGGPLRWGATTANAAFQVVNSIADQLRLGIMSKYGLQNPMDIVRYPIDILYSMFSSFHGNFGGTNELMTKFVQSGAANSTLARGFSPSTWMTKMPFRTLNPAQKTLRVFRNVLLDTPARFANAVEETTKLTGLRRGIRIEGLDKLPPDQAIKKLEEIVTEVRNYAGSPDFPRGGEVSREINLVFMFFKARLLGMTTDIARLAGATGGKNALTSWAKLSAIVGIPALTLATLNHSDEYKEDYEKIPINERQNNFMIPRDKFFFTEDGERVRDYFRIPKRDITQLFSNFIDEGVSFARSEDEDAFRQFAITFLEDISPISIEGKTWQERLLESPVSSMNPMIKGTIEMGVGKNTFFHSDLIPERLKAVYPSLQYRKTTPEMYKKLGEILEWSPLLMQHAVNTFTGGMVEQFIPGELDEGRDVWSVWPVMKRFTRSRVVSVDEQVGRIRGFAMAADSTNVVFTNEAEAIVDEWDELPPGGAKTKLAEMIKTDPTMAKKVIDIKNQRDKGLSYADRQILAEGVENGSRALAIYNEMKLLASDELRTEYWLELVDKKIITEQVAFQLQFLIANPEKAKELIDKIKAKSQ